MDSLPDRLPARIHGPVDDLDERRLVVKERCNDALRYGSQAGQLVAGSKGNEAPVSTCYAEGR